MSLNAKEQPRGGKPIDPVDAGSYPARLVQVIDMGVQEQSYNGEAKAPKQEINTTYEALDEFLKNEDGSDNEEKPYWFSENFALNHLSSDRAKSTERYYALDPKGKWDGDWTKLVNTPCVITVIQQPDKKTPSIIRNKIANVSAMRDKDAIRAKELVNPEVVFSLENDSKENFEVFEKLPDWIKDRIKKALNFEDTAFGKAFRGEKPAPAKVDRKPITDDEIPFEGEPEPDDGNW